MTHMGLMLQPALAASACTISVNRLQEPAQVRQLLQFLYCPVLTLLHLHTL